MSIKINVMTTKSNSSSNRNGKSRKTNATNQKCTRNNRTSNDVFRCVDRDSHFIIYNLLYNRHIKDIKDIFNMVVYEGGDRGIYDTFVRVDTKMLFDENISYNDRKGEIIGVLRNLFIFNTKMQIFNLSKYSRKAISRYGIEAFVHLCANAELEDLLVITGYDCVIEHAAIAVNKVVSKYLPASK